MLKEKSIETAFFNDLKILNMSLTLKAQGVREHWTVKYTGTQYLIKTLSHLSQKLRIPYLIRYVVSKLFDQ